jgi:hypothetical protein
MDFAEFFEFKTGDTSFKKGDTKKIMIRTALRQDNVVIYHARRARNGELPKEKAPR